MATHKRCGWWILAIGLVLSATTAPAWAVDTDGDGVDDAIDLCNNTPPGIPVDAEGRPLGDIDGDCDTDMDDFTLFQQSMTGPLAPVGACCYYPDGVCVLETEAECTGAWHGAGTTCYPNPCSGGPDMVIVPAGKFEMGDTLHEGGADELPVHDVYLDAYYIDAFEITNQQYADALNWAWGQGGLIEVTAGGVVRQFDGLQEPYCVTTSSSSYSRIHWDGNTFTVTPGKENHPMVMVIWHGAVAFSNWRSAMEGRTPCYDLATWTCDFDADGFRLPTEAEWEKAAGWDPVQQGHFRFGEHSNGCGFSCLDGHRANYWNSGDPFETGPYPWTTPVGFYNGELHYKADFGWPGNQETYQTQDAQSYYGCRDMSGNVWEYCHDWYDSGYYTSSPYHNPTGPASGMYRVVRGGNWEYEAYVSRSAHRVHESSIPYFNLGFRCVAGTP